MRIGNVGGVVIECRQCADAARHDRHRMRIAAEALEEPHHLLVHHRVPVDAVVEVGLLRRGRQFAVEQQVAGLQKVAVLGELFDRIAAIEQNAFVAVDVGDLGLAARGRRKARIVGEHPALAVELRNVDDVGTDRARDKSACPNCCCRPSECRSCSWRWSWRPWSSPRIGRERCAWKTFWPGR